MGNSASSSSTLHIYADAVALLKALPQGIANEPEARAQFETFRATHPDIEAELCLTPSAVRDSVEYDLLIEAPGGVVGVSWRPNDGIPWTVKYAEHWTAIHVLSVGKLFIEVQHALLLFKLIGGDHSNLLDRLLHYALIQHAIQQSPPPVAKVELQAAADRFRKARGLLSAEATQRWLREVGLTPQGMEKFLLQIVQTGKLKRKVTRSRMQPFFEEHAGEFDLLKLVIVEIPSEMLAATLASEGRKHGLLTAIEKVVKECHRDAEPLTARLSTQRMFELPPAFLVASAGTIVGPTRDGNTYRVTEVLHRRPAAFDAETRRIIEERLFKEWLNERRHQIDVRWYLS